MQPIAFNNFGRSVLDLFFPPRCAFCSSPKVKSDMLLCRECEAKLPYSGALLREQRLPSLVGCYSPLLYKGSVRQSLLRFKFKGMYSYSETYAKLISKCIDECEVSCDIISWVPVSRLRLHARGYDQAQKIAQELAKLRGLPLERLVRKRRHNRRQSSISDASKRKANVSGVYECLKPQLVEGKCILLVDDIVTTGSTLSSCAETLKAAGAQSVEAVTVARAEKSGSKHKKDRKEHSIRLY